MNELWGCCEWTRINRFLFRPTRSTGRTRLNRIGNDRRIANWLFSKFQLTRFHDWLELNGSLLCLFRFRLYRCAFDHPLPHRARFRLRFVMRLHVSLQSSCISTTLETPRALVNFLCHLFSQKKNIKYKEEILP